MHVREARGHYTELTLTGSEKRYKSRFSATYAKAKTEDTKEAVIFVSKSFRLVTPAIEASPSTSEECKGNGKGLRVMAARHPLKA